MDDVETTDVPSGWAQEIRVALSCAVRQASEVGKTLKLSANTAKGFAERHLNTRVSDNQEKLLLLIAAKSGRPNLTADLSLQNDFTLIDCFSPDEFAWYLDSVEAQGFVSPSSQISVGGLATAKLRLSMNGWRQVQPLQHPGGIPGRCFVAMWLDESMDEAFDLGIVPAVKDCELPTPLRIDKKEHNNQITDEIMAGIRDCEFVIADFTGNRGGVYYEAGFALGLGRQVIYCCKDKDFDKLHFDTRGISHIAWKTPADLREKLANRIKTTIIPKA